MLSDLF